MIEKQRWWAGLGSSRTNKWTLIEYQSGAANAVDSVVRGPFFTTTHKLVSFFTITIVQKPWYRIFILIPEPYFIETVLLCRRWERRGFGMVEMSSSAKKRTPERSLQFIKTETKYSLRLVSSIDYGCADKKNRRVKRRALCHWIGLDFLFQHIPIITAEKLTIKPKTCIQTSKISCSGCHLKLSDSKSSCKVAVLHLLLNWRPSIALCLSADESRSAFRLFIPFLTPVSLLETERLFQDCHTARGQLKSTICTSVHSLWYHLGRYKNVSFISYGKKKRIKTGRNFKFSSSGDWKCCRNKRNSL